jgi:hypothetical protein
MLNIVFAVEKNDHNVLLCTMSRMRELAKI